MIYAKKNLGGGDVKLFIDRQCPGKNIYPKPVQEVIRLIELEPL